MTLASLGALTDETLHGEVKRLAGRANTLLAELLAHLAEIEARGIHRERACSSLYVYCVYELRMSEDEAQRRCRAARLARQFPELLRMLAEASIHLTGILLIGPHLTPENRDELLARVRFRTKREIERLVAELAPSPDAPARIEPLHEGATHFQEPIIAAVVPARTPTPGPRSCAAWRCPFDSSSTASARARRLLQLTEGNAAGRDPGSSSTISSRTYAEAQRRSRISLCTAGRTTHWRPSKTSVERGFWRRDPRGVPSRADPRQRGSVIVWPPLPLALRF